MEVQLTTGPAEMPIEFISPDLRKLYPGMFEMFSTRQGRQGMAQIFMGAAAGILASQNGQKEISNQMLTEVSENANLAGVKSPLAQLLDRLNQATAAKGRKAELAEYLKAPRPCVSDWLSGKREPSGETTLRLLQWVEQQERQQNKGTGRDTPPPAPKTQSKASNEKTPQSGRKKH